MFEVATALMGLFSASIFMAYAVNAYQARLALPERHGDFCPPKQTSRGASSSI